MINIDKLKEKVSEIDKEINQLKNSISQLEISKEEVVDQCFYKYLLESKVLGQFYLELDLDNFPSPRITLWLDNELGRKILEVIKIFRIAGYRTTLKLSKNIECYVDFDNETLEINPYSSDFDQVNQGLAALGIEKGLEELWNWEIQQELEHIKSCQERIEKLRKSMPQKNTD